MWKNYLGLGFGAVVLVALAFQHQTLRGVKADLAELRGQPVTAIPGTAAPGETRRVERTRVNDGDVQARLAALESAVLQLTKASEYLMERGQLPLAANKKDELHRKFMDASAPDRDRLQALGLLRRNNDLSDEVLQSAVD